MTIDINKVLHNNNTFRDNVTIIRDANQIAFDNVKQGIIIVWVTWSIGYLNCQHAIDYLKNKKYQGQIFVIDTDLIPADTRKKVFASKLHGWGEIFIIKNGQITECFDGKESFLAFKRYFDNIADT